MDAQGEYNIPPDDNENEDDGGADLHSAPPVSPPPPDPTTPSDSIPPGDKWQGIQTPSPWRWAPYLMPQAWVPDYTGRGRQRAWSSPPAGHLGPFV